MFQRGLFIFRRDLRVFDNIALNTLHEKCENIYPIFIFTPEQITSKNAFKSDKAVQFMLECLDDLEDQTAGKLQTFYGKNTSIIVDCIRTWNIDVVAFNVDYSPYAMKRDAEIVEVCKRMNVQVLTAHDYYMNIPGSILTVGGTPYQKFTPYYEVAHKKRVDAPKIKRNMRFVSSNGGVSHTISLDDAKRRFCAYGDKAIQGGRDNALEQMRRFSRIQTRYAVERNDMSEDTSGLSAYIKFGCVSIREVYAAFKHANMFIRQLYWRDFYANILYVFPHVLGKAMKPKYVRIKWRYNAAWFKAWCEGRTGFPIVDAGMRQLNETGWMHNRARLIVASFLVKTLLISWEHGEKYFAQRLVDYDPASNNGNWQWVAGTGADSQPYFRIFNPTEQGKRYDSDCEYIKKWIPELGGLSPREIHRWTENEDMYGVRGYPKPICDYREQKEEALKMYADVFKA